MYDNVPMNDYANNYTRINRKVNWERVLIFRGGVNTQPRVIED